MCIFLYPSICFLTTISDHHCNTLTTHPILGLYFYILPSRHVTLRSPRSPCFMVKMFVHSLPHTENNISRKSRLCRLHLELHFFLKFQSPVHSLFQAQPLNIHLESSAHPLPAPNTPGPSSHLLTLLLPTSLSQMQGHLAPLPSSASFLSFHPAAPRPWVIPIFSKHLLGCWRNVTHQASTTTHNGDIQLWAGAPVQCDWPPLILI